MLRSYAAPVGLAVAGLVLLGLWASLVQQSPSFRTESQTVEENLLALTVGFTYEVEMTAPTLIWPEGTILESDRVLYPYPGSPVIRVQPFVQAESDLGASVKVTPEVSVEVWGKTLTGQPVWSLPLESSTLDSITLDLTGAESDRWVGPPVELDVNPLRERLQAIRDEFGFVQIAHGVQVELRLRGQSEGTGQADGSGQAGGSERAGAIHLSAVLPITFEGQGFVAQPLDQVTVTDLTTASREVEERIPIGLLTRILAAWQFLAGGLVALAAAAWLVTRTLRPGGGSILPEHQRFKAWITEGSVSADGAVHTEVSSLEGLVDLAIDMNKRVIFDRMGGRYHVLDGDILYTYWIPQRGASRRSKSRPLGELLIQSGVVTADQVKNALQFQRIADRPLGECLIALDFVDEMTLYTTLAAQCEMVYLELDPNGLVIDTQWLTRLTVRRARVLQVLPLGLRTDGTIAVAITNPLDRGITAALTELLAHPVSAVVSSPSQIRSAIERAEAGTLVSLPPHPIAVRDDQPELRLTRMDLTWLREIGSKEPVPIELILKAAGYLEGEMSRFLTDSKKTLHQALIESAGVHPDAVQLAVGAQTALMGKQSQAGAAVEIDLIDLLINSSRLPLREAQGWREQAETQARSVDQILLEAHVISHSTLIRAHSILSGLRRLEEARVPHTE